LFRELSLHVGRMGIDLPRELELMFIVKLMPLKPLMP
jgi:hypothetical protein